jgi:hypothetical protein
MYKALGVAVLLLGTVAFTGRNSTAAAPVGPAYPLIVAKGKLPNQTATIPTSTIYTPSQTGMYRLSVYATLLSAPCTTGLTWYFNLGWVDDAGTQTMNDFLYGYDCNLGPFLQLALANSNAGNVPGGTIAVFEAKAGQPITYSVTNYGEPDGTSYSLYYTLERME